MDLVLMVMLAIFLMATALYAHICIPRFTAGALKVIAAHSMLVVVGIAAGTVGGIIYRSEPLLALLSVLSGFGVVHVPAAVILFFKQQRHSGKT
jgi:hypothetical protein